MVRGYCLYPDPRRNFAFLPPIEVAVGCDAVVLQKLTDTQRSDDRRTIALADLLYGGDVEMVPMIVT